MLQNSKLVNKKTIALPCFNKFIKLFGNKKIKNFLKKKEN